MVSISTLLRQNRNYRYLWFGQVVSEVGDHFNTVAVLSLSLHLTGQGAAVGALMIARLIPGLVAAPIAGIALDRLDRRTVMLASDLVRAVLAFALLLSVQYRSVTMLYVLSGVLFFASPFFTAGRSAVLPSIASPDELHTANSVMQTTAWLTLAIGALAGGFATAGFGYSAAFVLNGVSFLFSAFCVWQLRGDRGEFKPSGKTSEQHPLRDLNDGFLYIRKTPLVLGVTLGYIGWAGGGGAAQILFTLLGEQVFRRGPAGMGVLWGMAGVGLVLGGFVGLYLGRRLSWHQYVHSVWIGYLIHGLAYILFSLGSFAEACFWIVASRTAMGANNVQNRTAVLRAVPDALRGRVLTTMEAVLNATMLISLAIASHATLYYDPRTIATWAGVASTFSALPWAWMTFTGRLQHAPEPAPTLGRPRD